MSKYPLPENASVIDEIHEVRQEIISAIRDLKQDIRRDMNQRFDNIEQRLNKIESDIHYIHNDTKTIPELFKLIEESDLQKNIT